MITRRQGVSRLWRTYQLTTVDSFTMSDVARAQRPGLNDGFAIYDSASPRQANYPNVVLATPGLRAYYRFASGAVGHDETGNYDATVVGSPTVGLGALRGGTSGSALSGFSASNYVQLPSGLSVADGSSLTVEFWYRLAAMPGVDCSAFVFGNPSAADNRIEVQVPSADNSTITFTDGDPSDRGQAFSRWSNYGGSWTGLWLPFTFVADASTALLSTWVNGQGNGTSLWTPQGDIFSGGCIGGWPAAGTFTTGQIAEFAVYDTALTPATIYDHINAA